MSEYRKAVEGVVNPQFNGRCLANNCPCAGNISESRGGDWMCRFHFGLSANLWPAMTERLNDCLWLLKIVKWIREEGHDHANDRITQRVAKAVDNVPELKPKDGEHPTAWARRAEGWISRPVSNLRKHQADRIKAAVSDSRSVADLAREAVAA